MRHTRRILACLAVVVLLAAGASRAEEIITFKNGTAMPIRSHELKGSMIHVDLGADNFMAFPLSMVDKVEVAGKEIVLDPSFSNPSNVISPGANHPVRGSIPSRFSDSKNKQPLETAAADPAVEYDGKMGVAVYRPDYNSAAPNKRELGITGNGRARGGSSGMLGTRRVGGRNVIGDGPARRGSNRPPLVGLEPKVVTAPDPPPAEESQSSADSASGD